MSSRPNFMRGFSLIEVLIAVAVLSFGLLALASLQASLIRASAESKARSVALSVAKDEAEDLRAYRTSPEYVALTDGTRTVSGLGGVDYTVTRSVTRYAYDGVAGVFEPVADTGALAAEYVSENEFKKVTVSVGWTDNDGQPRSIVIDDAIGSVAPENTGRLARRKAPPRNRGPEILISNPASEQGVIPIAIGEGSETAATNPRPDVDTGVALQTSYDIFTYAALNSTTARAQSRVETVIMGCRCDHREANLSQLNFRPTYWDGERYILPKEAPGNSLAGEANLQNNDPAQSILCSACCRDHHDPISVSGPKFSPRRNTHAHFLTDLTTAVTNNEYFEACRSIRVNGIHRIAADPYNEYLNTLKTAVASGETAPFTDPRPDGDATTGAQAAYVRFVIDYLDTQGGQSDPNAQLTQAVADGKAQAAGLNDPVQDVEEGDERWMHARGLYVDWLEAEALAAVDDSQDPDECPQPGPLTLTQCLLRVLPFTSINLTELSKWTPPVSANQAIYVANNDFVDSATSTDPVRGRVTAAAVGSAPATAEIRSSNTGLLANPDYAIDLADQTAQTNNIADQPDNDAQGFRIVGPSCGASGTLTLRGGDVGELPSSGNCDGSDATKPTAQTRVRLRLRTGLGPANATILLIGPDNTLDPTDNPTYVVASNQAWGTIGSLFLFPATGDPDVAGIWTLRIVNEDNGPEDTIEVAFSVDFLYTATFTAQLTGYTFVGTTQPSGTLSTGGNCSYSGSVNPTTCSTTQPGVATNWTIGTYNYEATKASTPVACTGGAAGQTCPSTKACRRFDVTSVAIDNGQTATIASTANDGLIAESTVLSFGGITDGAAITVGFTPSLNDAPTCVYSGTGNQNQCNKYNIFCP